MVAKWDRRSRKLFDPGDSVSNQTTIPGIFRIARTDTCVDLGEKLVLFSNRYLTESDNLVKGRKIQPSLKKFARWYYQYSSRLRNKEESLIQMCYRMSLIKVWGKIIIIFIYGDRNETNPSGRLHSMALIGPMDNSRNKFKTTARNRKIIKAIFIHVFEKLFSGYRTK